MKIKWWGHDAFLITSEGGVKIITDPYKPGGGIGYSRITDSADIVTVSHDHFDHNYVGGISGNPIAVRAPQPQTIKGISVRGVQVYHDKNQGRERGRSIIFVLGVDGMQIVHLGDLGHVLSNEQVSKIGGTDVLLLPIGGFYTIDSEEADFVAGQIKPKVIIPMHYKTPALDFPIATLDAYLRGKKNVERVGGPEVTITKSTLPAEQKIIVLDYVK
ncbi:MAG: MBL fold metallo-hydrolase [bacterium]